MTARTAGETLLSDPQNNAIVVKRLHPESISHIDRVFREAFCLQIKHPDPDTFAPGRSCLARLIAEPEGSLGVFRSGELVAVAFATIWGSVGVFGPLAVRPVCWNLGLGQFLLRHATQYFDEKSVKDMVLCTFPDSVKHVLLYKKFGFHPRFLIAMMSKPVELVLKARGDHQDPGRWLADLSTDSKDSGFVLDLFSSIDSANKMKMLEECRRITNAIYEGLDLTTEINVVDKLLIGETLLLSEGRELLAFAVCHHGIGSETETDVLYVKFAAVLPKEKADEIFKRLLRSCYALAQAKNANLILFGVNTARQEAFDAALAEGFKIDSTSLAMQSPNHSCYNHGGVYVIDDWR